MDNLLDKTDRAILRALQDDAALSMDALAERVHLSRNACWRRVKILEDTSVIKRRVAIVDPAKVGKPLFALVLVRTQRHDPEWTKSFAQALHSLPEVIGAYRMSGDLDYVLRVRISDMAAYDAFYKSLTSRVSVSDISASFVMEEIVDTTAIPL